MITVTQFLAKQDKESRAMTIMIDVLESLNSLTRRPIVLNLDALCYRNYINQSTYVYLSWTPYLCCTVVSKLCHKSAGPGRVDAHITRFTFFIFTYFCINSIFTKVSLIF